MTFSDVVEAIKSFSSEEKLEIQLLLQQYIAVSIQMRYNVISQGVGARHAVPLRIVPHVNENCYIREERREEIYQNFQAAQVEQQNSELKFSSNMDELRQLIEE